MPYKSEYYHSCRPIHQGWLSFMWPRIDAIPHINPYPEGSRDHTEWQAGWDEARADMEAEAAGTPALPAYASRELELVPGTS